MVVTNKPLYNIREILELKILYKKGKNHPIKQYSATVELWDRMKIVVFPIDTEKTLWQKASFVGQVIYKMILILKNVKKISLLQAFQ